MIRMARRHGTKQNMQKDIRTFSTLVPNAESVVVADIVPDQEILVKRVILLVTPENRPQTTNAGLSGTYQAGVTESDNGAASPTDLASDQRLVRSTSGNAYGINNVDTTLTMRKEGGSGVHAIISNFDTQDTLYSGVLIIHYLEV